MFRIAASQTLPLAKQTPSTRDLRRTRKSSSSLTERPHHHGPRGASTPLPATAWLPRIPKDARRFGEHLELERQAIPRLGHRPVTPTSRAVNTRDRCCHRPRAVPSAWTKPDLRSWFPSHPMSPSDCRPDADAADNAVLDSDTAPCYLHLVSYRSDTAAIPSSYPDELSALHWRQARRPLPSAENAHVSEIKRPPSFRCCHRNTTVPVWVRLSQRTTAVDVRIAVREGADARISVNCSTLRRCEPFPSNASRAPQPFPRAPRRRHHRHGHPA